MMSYFSLKASSSVVTSYLAAKWSGFKSQMSPCDSGCHLWYSIVGIIFNIITTCLTLKGNVVSKPVCLRKSIKFSKRREVRQPIIKESVPGYVEWDGKNRALHYSIIIYYLFYYYILSKCLQISYIVPENTGFTEC